LGLYLNQKVCLQTKTGDDAYGQPQFTASVIRARKENCRRMTRDAFGNEVLSETTVLLSDPVQPGDRIDGRQVVSVLDMVWSDGTTEGYEALL